MFLQLPDKRRCSFLRQLAFIVTIGTRITSPRAQIMPVLSPERLKKAEYKGRYCKDKTLKDCYIKTVMDYTQPHSES